MDENDKHTNHKLDDNNDNDDEHVAIKDDTYTNPIVEVNQEI